MEGELLEGEAEQHDDGLGDVAIARHGFVHPVAHVGVLEGAPLDARQVDLPAEAAADEDAEAVPTAELALPVAGAAAGGEHPPVLGRVGLSG